MIHIIKNSHITYIIVLLLLLTACNIEPEPVVAEQIPELTEQIPELTEQTPEQAYPYAPEPEINTEQSTFPFPFPFSTVDLYGNQVTHETLGNYEAFFVYLWTTWCINCVVGMPDLAYLAETYAGRVGFLSLLGDFDTASDTAMYIKENAGVTFMTVNAMDDEFSELADLLNSGFVPTSVILGQDGTAIGGQIVGGGIDRFQSAIDHALGE